MSASVVPLCAIHCQAKVAVVSPSASAIESADAVSVSPTRAVPEIAGKPVGAVLDAPSGPVTAPETAADSGRSSSAHTAPASVHARPYGSSSDTSPLPDGCTVSSQRFCRFGGSPSCAVSATCAAAVTVPPPTVSAWSRIASAVIVVGWLNAIRNVNAFVPSCVPGRFSNVAVSSEFDMPPNAVAPRMSAPEASESFRRIYSIPSSLSSSCTGTVTCISVSPGSKVSFPLVAS